MTSHRFTRRGFLQTAAAGAAVPYVITSTALGGPDKPPASERVTVGHIGVGGRGNFFEFQHCQGCQSVAVADPYKDRRRGPCQNVRRQGLCRFPRTAGPHRHRRRGRRHAGPLARADRHRGGPGQEGRLRGEAAGDQRRARPGLPQGLPGAWPHLPIRHPAAEFEPLPAGLRVGPQRPDRQDHAAGGHRPQRRPGRIDQGNRRAAESRLRHVARPRAQGALHGRSLPSAGNLLDLRLLDRLPGRLGRPSAGHPGLGQRRRPGRADDRSKAPARSPPRACTTRSSTGT